MLGERRVAGCLGHDDCAERRVCPLGDDAADILDAVYAADGLILATPVYYENVSAQMKAFMDRNAFRYAHDEWLRAKAVGLVADTAGSAAERPELLAAARRLAADLAEALLSGA